MSTVPTTAPAPAAALPASSPLPPWMLAAVAAGLVVALFTSNILRLARVWDLDDSYSHGYLVLPICLALAYRIYQRVGPPVRGELGWGLVTLSFGLGCQFAFTLVPLPFISYLAMVAVLRGLLVCAGGRKWAAEFNFPLVFLFFMFPLPWMWTSYSALWLQDVVSQVSETVISLFVVCHRVGHTIRLAGVDQSLIVAQECSGLGQIVSFLAFAALLGHLMARPIWYRVLLIVAAVPIAVAANTLRVVMMNLGAVYFGTDWMGGAMHDAPALFSIPVGIALFLLCDGVASRLVDERGTGGSAPSPASSAAQASATTPRGEVGARSLASCSG